MAVEHADGRERVVSEVRERALAAISAEWDADHECDEPMSCDLEGRIAAGVLQVVADWLDERAAALPDGGWHEQAAHDAEERRATVREVARWLREG